MIATYWWVLGVEQREEDRSESIMEMMESGGSIEPPGVAEQKGGILADCVLTPDALPNTVESYLE